MILCCTSSTVSGILYVFIKYLLIDPKVCRRRNFDFDEMIEYGLYPGADTQEADVYMDLKLSREL